jgi:hypothetical protein
MSQVSTDLESVINFRSHLIAFNRTLADEFSRMHTHWQSLGDVWTDVKYHKFGRALEEVERGIRQYLAVTPEHEAHLLGLIEALRAFLERRL